MTSYFKKFITFIRKLHYATHVFLLILKGSARKKCPCCGYEGPFETIGTPPRHGAICKQCGSYERHRLLALADKKYNFFNGRDVLHFAPEKTVGKLIRDKANTYVTADIMAGRADRVFNIENIEDDSRWDVIVCSHVLEHVNDHKALNEMHRVLRDSGILIVMVPIVEGWEVTYENNTIVTDAARNAHFGQADHLRYYGRDIRDRISSHGFSVREETAYGADVVTYGLLRGEKVFICQKNSN